MENKDLSLIMTFKNEDGKESTVTLKQVKETITSAEIEAAMDVIISTDIFSSTGGNLVSKIKAQVVDKAIEEYKFA